MSSELLSQIDENIQRHKAEIELADALDRLYKNRDFKLVFLNGYFEKEALRLVHLRGDTNVLDTVKQANILRDLDGIAALKGYISTLRYKAELAEKSVEADESLRETLAIDGEI